jgi:hypothetical protein
VGLTLILHGLTILRVNDYKAVLSSEPQRVLR